MKITKGTWGRLAALIALLAVLLSICLAYGGPALLIDFVNLRFCG